MKSFEEHLRGAKAHNREDKIWLVTCFSGKMAKLCAKYGFPDDEDMFVYLIEHFLRDLERFFPLSAKCILFEMQLFDGTGKPLALRFHSDIPSASRSSDLLQQR